MIPSRKNGVFAWDWTLWLACFVCRRDYGLCGCANALTAARPARLDNPQQSSGIGTLRHIYRLLCPDTSLRLFVSLSLCRRLPSSLGSRFCSRSAVSGDLLGTISIWANKHFSAANLLYSPPQACDRVKVKDLCLPQGHQHTHISWLSVPVLFSGPANTSRRRSCSSCHHKPGTASRVNRSMFTSRPPADSYLVAHGPRLGFPSS